jgi:hypothetical protein
MDMASSGNGRSRPQRQAILILGMHRSGASALAGVLRSLGVAAPKTLLMPDSSDPSGYWESVPLAKAHDELLTAAGSSWDDWRQLNPEWFNSSAAQHFKERISDILLDEYGDAPLFVIKDPRICRFVPFMSAILGEMNIGPVAFLMLRNPLETALSLERGERIALPNGLMLWLRHVLEAERHSRHMPRYFLTYEVLLMDWRRHLDLAAKKVGIVWPARSGASAAMIEQLPWLEWRHDRGDSKILEENPDVPPFVSGTYRIVRSMAAGGESRHLFDQIDVARTKFEGGCEVFGPMVAREEAAIGILEKALKESDADRAARLEQIKTFEKALRESEADRAARLEQIKILDKALQESETDRAARLEQIRVLDKALTEARLENQSRREELDQVYKSRWWRMTKPLRAISLPFRGKQGNGAPTRK